jgi:hypothetical protein
VVVVEQAVLEEMVTLAYLVLEVTVGRLVFQELPLGMQVAVAVVITMPI